MSYWLQRLFLLVLFLLAGFAPVYAQTLNYLETYDPIGIGTVPVYNPPLAGLHVQHTRFSVYEGGRGFRGTVLFNGDDDDPLGTHGGGSPPQLNHIPLTTTGVRWMWLPDQAAVRSGYNETQNWDDINNIGLCSYAHGFNVYAAQKASVALGMGARVHKGLFGYGESSIALGYHVHVGTADDDPSTGQGFILGSGHDASKPFVNDIPGTLMLGVGSQVPTMTFVPQTGGAEGATEPGRVGIGTTAPTQPLHIAHQNGSGGLTIQQLATNANRKLGLYFQVGSELQWNIGANFNNTDQEEFYIWSHNGPNPRLIINPEGVVGIGVPSGAALSSDYLLQVKGKIRAQEVLVETANWPDFVFRPGYPLLPIPALRSFIQANGHLPGLPSAQQAETEGIETSAMLRTLTQKVEELTLYILQLEQQMNNR